MNEQNVNIAIDRLRLADQMSRKYMDSPLYICISGGKDSTVIQQLAVESGLEVIFHHNHTTVDAPETVYFIHSEFARLRALGYRVTPARAGRSLCSIMDMQAMPGSRPHAKGGHISKIQKII